MNRGLTKFMLTTHVSISVGWFGTVAGFLVLAIAGFVSQADHIMRGAYSSMELLTRYLIVPLCFASLLTGIVQSLGTQWGLFKHYWIVVKLILTIAATVVLLVHLKPITAMSEAAATSSIFGSDLQPLRIQLIADAGAALLVLLVITTISIYKPWGRTAYGLKMHNNVLSMNKSKPVKRWTIYVLITLIVFVIIGFLLMHIVSGGLGRH